MKILLINICLRPYLNYVTFPLGFSYIVGAIQRAGFDFEILDTDIHRYTDEELEEEIRSRKFDVAAFGCIVTGYRHIKKLASMVRRVNKDAVIIAGNSVVDSIPNILLTKTEVNIGVLGEGDITIVELLRAIESGKPLDGILGICFRKDNCVVINPRRMAIADINEIPHPPWELFDMEAYINKAREVLAEPYPIPQNEIRPLFINTARGCIFRCTFCYHVFQKDKYRFRSPKSILSEIKELQDRYGVNYVQFSDELTFFSKPQAEEFVNEIVASGIRFYWTADCRANLFTRKDVEFLKKMKEVGCVDLGYSLESGDAGILESMHKMLRVEDFVEQAKAVNEAGMGTKTSIVLGYPQETPETLKKTFDVCYDLDIYPSSGYLLPQPGTPMYAVAKEMGLIVDDEEYLLKMGNRQDFTLNFTQMPTDFFQAEVRGHLKRISDKIGLGLDEGKLLKTGHYKSKNTK